MDAYEDITRLVEVHVQNRYVAVIKFITQNRGRLTCGSAFKKPHRKICRPIVSQTVFITSRMLRPIPGPSIVSRSVIRVAPSIYSIVSTRPVLKAGYTFGTYTLPRQLFESIFSSSPSVNDSRGPVNPNALSSLRSQLRCIPAPSRSTSVRIRCKLSRSCSKSVSLRICSEMYSEAKERGKSNSRS